MWSLLSHFLIINTVLNFCLGRGKCSSSLSIYSLHNSDIFIQKVVHLSSFQAIPWNFVSSMKGDNKKQSIRQRAWLVICIYPYHLFISKLAFNYILLSVCFNLVFFKQKLLSLFSVFKDKEQNNIIPLESQAQRAISMYVIQYITWGSGTILSKEKVIDEFLSPYSGILSSTPHKEQPALTNNALFI